MSNESNESPEVSPEVEQEARLMGWKPKEEFRGDPDQWRDAKSFLEFGKSVQPILRQHNAALRNELQMLQRELQGLREVISTNERSMEALKAYQQEDVARQIKATKRELRTKLREAVESGDESAITQLEDQLDEVDDLKGKLQETAPSQKSPASAAPPAPAPHPDFATWQVDNPWYGTDERRTRLAMVIAQELRANPANNGLVGRAFFDKVGTAVLETLPLQSHRQGESSNSRVEGRRSPTHSQPGKERNRSFAALPADAQQACAALAVDLVGPGKVFKTLKEWQEHYAKSYVE